MPSLQQGSIHLGRIAGIDLYLHWTWFLIAIFEIQNWQGRYSSVLWSALEYLALFAIVLTHEFGHALACRQVGGTANRIMLWPFGGVAYVDPPQRPGATLWSIAAGPLVNVALLTVLGVPNLGVSNLGVPQLAVPALFGWTLGWAHTMPNAYMLIERISWINFGLLIFNMLPIYPLDGGQILRSLLWFPLGRAHSLLVVTILGMFGIAGYFGLTLWRGSLWLGAIGIFMLMNCWGGFRHARALLQQAKLPRRKGFACPSCRTEPLLGERWKCGKCGQKFDTFLTGGICPHCAAQYSTTMCGDCGKSSPMGEWVDHSMAGPGVVNGGF
jgi:Zn-dependent protease